MSETADYLPTVVKDGTTLTSTLTIKSVSVGGAFTCIFVYQTDGVDLEVSAATTLKLQVSIIRDIPECTGESYKVVRFD